MNIWREIVFMIETSVAAGVGRGQVEFSDVLKCLLPMAMPRAQDSRNKTTEKEGTPTENKPPFFRGRTAVTLTLRYED
jgi:hypothetical protein